MINSQDRCVKIVSVVLQDSVGDGGDGGDLESLRGKPIISASNPVERSKWKRK